MGPAGPRTRTRSSPPARKRDPSRPSRVEPIGRVTGQSRRGQVPSGRHGVSRGPNAPQAIGRYPANPPPARRAGGFVFPSRHDSTPDTDLTVFFFRRRYPTVKLCPYDPRQRKSKAISTRRSDCRPSPELAPMELREP